MSDYPLRTGRAQRFAASLLLAGTAACGTTVQDISLFRTENSLDGVVQATPTSTDRDQGLGSSTAYSRTDPSRGLAEPGPISIKPGSSLQVRGVTATTITLGYMYSDDAQAFASQFGAEAPGGNTQRAMYKAVADDLNSRGGILGHRVSVVGYNMDTAQQVSNPALAEEEMCTHFTQDQPVFAAFLGSLATATPCLSRAGVASIAIWNNGNQPIDVSSLKNYLLYAPGHPVLERYVPVLVDRLMAQGYFHGWDTLNGQPGTATVKVGLFYNNQLPGLRRWAALLKQALAARGYAVEPANEFTFAGTVGWSTAADSAVLRFSSNRVTHVFSPLSFEPQAENQHYRPRYGVDSYMQGMWGIGDQHRGALGVGWWPSYSISQTGNPNAPSPPVSSLQTRCQQVMTNAGVSIDWSKSGITHFLALSVCDAMWSLDKALEKSGAISLPGLAAGFNALGTVASPVTFSETWGPDRHASASAVADIRFDDKCRCWVYTKTLTRL